MTVQIDEPRHSEPERVRHYPDGITLLMAHTEEHERYSLYVMHEAACYYACGITWPHRAMSQWGFLSHALDDAESDLRQTIALGRRGDQVSLPQEDVAQINRAMQGGER